jgi:hypothetical protein
MQNETAASKLSSADAGLINIDRRRIDRRRFGQQLAKLFANRCGNNP